MAEAEEGDGNESAGVEEVELEVEVEEEGQCRGLGKEDRPRSKCGRMCTKYRSRREARGGGTRDKRVPLGRGGRWGRAPHVTGSYEQDGNEC